ncbi:MAG: RNA 3'-terminal phosphate cyclase [bacterium]|nr:RNA 3'-terminal phosphate cyclase [bacterium]
MIHIDGSFGEGGGQILRTSLALSLVTGKAFRIERIRANRKKPGLARQHLTAVNAAAEIGRAEVKGNELRSQNLYFSPKAIEPGKYHFSIGTAGSCTLVLQTILPALLLTRETSAIILEGGTHNSMAPSFDFLYSAFLPIVAHMGARIEAHLERPGFYPVGGGKFFVSIAPCENLRRVELLKRGELLTKRAEALISKLPAQIAERELKVVRERLSWERRELHIKEIANSPGPGNALSLFLEFVNISEVFVAFGKRGVRAETVAKRLVKELREYLDSGVPVGRHLADQLILPIALAGGGKFRTLSPSQHTLTNIDVVKHFLDIDIQVRQESPVAWEVELQGLVYEG